MPEIRYEALQEVVTEANSGPAAPVYLLYGDEFLYKAAFKSLLEAIVPPDHQGLNYEAVDGSTADIYEVVARLNTFPLLPGAKVTCVHDTQIFYSRVTTDELLNRSKEAFERQNLKESGRHFMRMLTATGLSLDDVCDRRREGPLNLGESLGVAEEACGPWLEEVVDYCLREQMGPAVYREDAHVLTETIKAGLPRTNHLILTAGFVDKRCELFKTIRKIGVAIDCSVPQGDKSADKRRQKAVLKAHMKETLGRAGKTMVGAGFEALLEKTGGSLRNFHNELEKLIAFVGNRREILVSDVRGASEKTKQDPIYELSNAIGERDTGKAFFLLDSLLKGDCVPLQVLSAAANQLRKMILMRDFIRNVPECGWKRGMSYGTFQKVAWPVLRDGKGEALGGNAHPFAVYKTLLHSENFTFNELSDALGILLDIDIRLKSGVHDAQLMLEQAIMRICGTSADTSKNLGRRANLFSETS
jgi:DNA polymerase-3 subunit delta